MKQKKYLHASLFYDLADQSDAHNPVQIYNIACAFSKANQTKMALITLKKAVQSGFNNQEHMMKDADLDNIRRKKAFKKILASMKNTN